jgi:hypothetical protein
MRRMRRFGRSLWGWILFSANRAGNVKDMARVALLLGSQGSEYVNGQIISVNGGYLLNHPRTGLEMYLNKLGR